MGLDVHGTRFLLFARRHGADFTSTLTIGRQGLHLTRRQLGANLAAFGHRSDDRTVERIFSASDGFSEELLRALGAERVESIDYSDYEGAGIVFDLNREIPREMRARHSVVLDSGSLEHVFDFPRALRNCLEMVQPGGHFLGITPGNNFMGHGFYQFSPELFLSAFRPDLGFELRQLIAFEDTPRAPWYRVSRPAHLVDKRVIHRGRRAVYLAVMARRVGAGRPLASAPQQSDYLNKWEGARGGGVARRARPPRRSGLLGALLRRTPDGLKRLAKRALGHQRRKLRFDPRFYHRIDWRRELAATGPANRLPAGSETPSRPPDRD